MDDATEVGMAFTCQVRDGEAGRLLALLVAKTAHAAGLQAQVRALLLQHPDSPALPTLDAAYEDARARVLAYYARDQMPALVCIVHDADG